MDATTRHDQSTKPRVHGGSNAAATLLPSVVAARGFSCNMEQCLHRSTPEGGAEMDDKTMVAMDVAFKELAASDLPAHAVINVADDIMWRVMEDGEDAVTVVADEFRKAGITQ